LVGLSVVGWGAPPRKMLVRPPEIEFGALSLQNILSGGSSFNDLYKNQVNQLAKVQLFKVDSHENHKFVQFKQY